MPMFPPYEAMLACAVFFLSLAVLLLVKIFVARQLRRFAASKGMHLLGYPQELLDATRLPFLMVLSLLIAVSQLTLPALYDRWLHFAWIVVLMVQVALWGNRIITVAVERAYERNRVANPAGLTHLMVAGLIGRILVWSVAALLTLDNLGFNITTLMASLGIGGIAVALAVQNILGDVFSSVSIALDKPFVIGDFIIVDDYLGTVEYVGLKTTRIRSLGGEQIIFSNSELLKNRIRNYKRMQERRIVFEFGVAHGTKADQLRRISPMLREIIEAAAADVRFDRAHFKSCGESAMIYEAVYHVLDPDYNRYMDIQQAINLALVERLAAQGIAFAHPMRTLVLPQPVAAYAAAA